MYSIVLTNGKIINVEATTIGVENGRIIKLYCNRNIVAEINMDNIVGWIETNYKAGSED